MEFVTCAMNMMRNRNNNNKKSDEGCLRFVVQCQQGNHRRKFADHKHVIDCFFLFFCSTAQKTERRGSAKIIFIAPSNFYLCFILFYFFLFAVFERKLERIASCANWKWNQIFFYLLPSGTQGFPFIIINPRMCIKMSFLFPMKTAFSMTFYVRVVSHIFMTFCTSAKDFYELNSLTYTENRKKVFLRANFLLLSPSCWCWKSFLLFIDCEIFSFLIGDFPKIMRNIRNEKQFSVLWNFTDDEFAELFSEWNEMSEH